MSRPSKWSGETTAIRVPKAIAPILLDYAQTLDSFVQNPNQNLFNTSSKKRHEPLPTPSKFNQ